MIVISRELNQSILIGKGIEVTVVEITEDKVRFEITLPEGSGNVVNPGLWERRATDRTSRPNKGE